MCSFSLFVLFLNVMVLFSVIVYGESLRKAVRDLSIGCKYPEDRPDGIGFQHERILLQEFLQNRNRIKFRYRTKGLLFIFTVTSVWFFGIYISSIISSEIWSYGILSICISLTIYIANYLSMLRVHKKLDECLAKKQ